MKIRNIRIIRIADANWVTVRPRIEVSVFAIRIPQSTQKGTTEMRSMNVLNWSKNIKRPEGAGNALGGN